LSVDSNLFLYGLYLFKKLNKFQFWEIYGYKKGIPDPGSLILGPTHRVLTVKFFG
jgi:hypothetical protein